MEDRSKTYAEELRASVLRGEQAREDTVALVLGQLAKLAGEALQVATVPTATGNVTTITMTNLDGTVVKLEVRASGPEVEY